MTDCPALSQILLLLTYNENKNGLLREQSAFYVVQLTLT